MNFFFTSGLLSLQCANAHFEYARVKQNGQFYPTSCQLLENPFAEEHLKVSTFLEYILGNACLEHKEHRYPCKVGKEIKQGHEKPQMPDSIIETFICR